MERLEDTSGRLDALYISLDVDRQAFAAMIGSDIPPNLTVAESWPALADGGKGDLLDWLRRHPKAGLVVIDPIAPLLSPDVTVAQWEVHQLRLIAAEYGVELVLTSIEEAPPPVDLLKEARHV